MVPSTLNGVVFASALLPNLLLRIASLFVLAFSNIYNYEPRSLRGSRPAAIVCLCVVGYNIILL